jgi:hypothetical protein
MDQELGIGRGLGLGLGRSISHYISSLVADAWAHTSPMV